MTEGSSTMQLTQEEYKRYGRQMILPGWGLPGQLKLKAARIAVVGAGGLGCPVLQYLAGAGVGTIDVFDHDEVSISNLHRQVLHSTDRVGINKAESAAKAMFNINPCIEVVPHPESIYPSTALAQLSSAEIIVDCTDRPFTRYLLADAAVRLDVPLVSGAAIASAGQWAVYGGVLPDHSGSSGSQPSDGVDAKGKSPIRKRACYRCIWPKPLPGANGRCEDVGVWGVVTGMVGTGMAGEVIKLILGNIDAQPMLQTLHLSQAPLIRSIRLRPRRADCIACGDEPTITDDLDAVGYDAFCGGDDPDEVSGMVDGEPAYRISATDLATRLAGSQDGRVRLIDVRPETEYGIGSIPGSENIPLDQILKDPSFITNRSTNNNNTNKSSVEYVLLCRRGNDSIIAANALRSVHSKSNPEEVPDAPRVVDVRGGLGAWIRDVDPAFPAYF